MPEEKIQNENLTPKPNLSDPISAPPAAPAAGGALNDDVAHILEEIVIPKKDRGGAPQKQTVFENVFGAPPKDSSVPPEGVPPPPTPLHKDIVQKLGGEEHTRAIRQTKLDENEKTGMVEVMPSKEVLDTIAPEGEKPFDMRALHTLKDDLQTLVDDNQMSMVKAAALEEEKRTKRTKEAPPAARKSGKGRMMKTVLIGATLLGLGLLGVGTIALISSERQAEVQVPLTEIMFSEQTLGFPLIAGRLASEAKQQLSLTRTQVSLTLGAIARIAPLISEINATGAQVQRPASTEEFFQAIGALPPPELTRSLSPEFFFGVHALDQNLPMLVIPVTSYERAFAGILEWESHINTELSPIFTLVPPETRDASGLPTQRFFEDVIIQNYDVRILRDQNGTARFLYAFPTRTILIIAESPNSFIEVLARLRAERRL